MTINFKVQRKCLRCKFKSFLVLVKTESPKLISPTDYNEDSKQNTKSSDPRTQKGKQCRKTGSEIKTWATGTGVLVFSSFTPDWLHSIEEVRGSYYLLLFASLNEVILTQHQDTRKLPISAICCTLNKHWINEEVKKLKHLQMNKNEDKTY